MKEFNGSIAEMLPLMQEVLQGGGEFRLFPMGTSMYPLLRQGKDSVILVALDVVRKGEIYLYRRSNGDFVLHRLIRIAEDGLLTFRGDNQTVEESGIRRDQIIARASKILRDEKAMSPCSRWYRITRLSTLARALRFRKRKK